MSVTIEVFDRFDHKLCELGAGEVQVGTRSWCLDYIGTADFQIPRTNAKLTRANFGQMNLIKIRSSHGIPDWGGRIKSVEWSTPEYVTITCESKESLLRRQTILNTDVSGITTGSWWQCSQGGMVRLVIQALLANGLGGLYLGAIDESGPLVGNIVSGEDVWETFIPRLRRASWWYETWVDADGKFYWQKRRGQDRQTQVRLFVGQDGVGLSGARYTIDYTGVITEGVAYGTATNWEHKYKFAFQRSDLLATYGVLMKSTDADDNSPGEALEAAKRITAEPKETLDLRIIDKSSAWASFWVGDTIMVNAPKMGWANEGGLLKPFRVTGLELQESVGAMRVIGEFFPTITWETAPGLEIDQSRLKGS